jgi:prevent-host-death family protein
MTTIPVTQARSMFADLINQVAYGGKRIAIGRKGKGRAVLVSMDDAEMLEALEKKADLALLRKRMKEPGESWEKVKAELGL